MANPTELSASEIYDLLVARLDLHLQTELEKLPRHPDLDPGRKIPRAKWRRSPRPQLGVVEATTPEAGSSAAASEFYLYSNNGTPTPRPESTVSLPSSPRHIGTDSFEYSSPNNEDLDNDTASLIPRHLLSEPSPPAASHAYSPSTRLRRRPSMPRYPHLDQKKEAWRLDVTCVATSKLSDITERSEPSPSALTFNASTRRMPWPNGLLPRDPSSDHTSAPVCANSFLSSSSPDIRDANAHLDHSVSEQELRGEQVRLQSERVSASDPNLCSEQSSASNQTSSLDIESLIQALAELTPRNSNTYDEANNKSPATQQDNMQRPQQQNDDSTTPKSPHRQPSQPPDQPSDQPNPASPPSSSPPTPHAAGPHPGSLHPRSQRPEPTTPPTPRRTDAQLKAAMQEDLEKVKHARHGRALSGDVAVATDQADASRRRAEDQQRKQERDLSWGERWTNFMREVRTYVPKPVSSSSSSESEGEGSGSGAGAEDEGK